MLYLNLICILKQKPRKEMTKLSSDASSTLIKPESKKNRIKLLIIMNFNSEIKTYKFIKKIAAFQPSRSQII